MLVWLEVDSVAAVGCLSSSSSSSLAGECTWEAVLLLSSSPQFASSQGTHDSSVVVVVVVVDAVLTAHGSHGMGRQTDDSGDEHNGSPLSTYCIAPSPALTAPLC